MRILLFYRGALDALESLGITFTKDLEFIIVVKSFM